MKNGTEVALGQKPLEMIAAKKSLPFKYRT